MSEQKHPKFGDRIRGIYAGESNPQRDGYFVRVIRRTGRMNHGTYYECTDGNGNFWQYPAEFTERLPNADHAARVAELEHRLANCDADLHAMQQAKDRAERMHADYLACEEPAAVSDPDLIALLPVWAGKWINDLKAASAQHMLQALNNGQSARLQRERADRAERRLGALQAFARDVMTSWPEGDVDGGALQDYAEKHGLIVPQEAIESCGDDCVCADYGQFPMTCYRKTELLTGQPA